MKQTISILLLAFFLAPTMDIQVPSQELTLKTQVQTLNEQVLQLQIQVAQCRAGAADIQAKLDSATLTSQLADVKAKHDSLDGELLKAYGGKEGDTIDWSTTPPSLKKKTTSQKP